MTRGPGEQFHMTRNMAAASLCASAGIFLVVSDLGEPQRVSRVIVEMALCAPLLVCWLTLYFRPKL